MAGVMGGLDQRGTGWEEGGRWKVVRVTGQFQKWEMLEGNHVSQLQLQGPKTEGTDHMIWQREGTRYGREGESNSNRVAIKELSPRFRRKVLPAILS